MYSDYRFLAKGVAQDDKQFNELEASTYMLASRNGEYYEICFLSRPMNPTYNEVKFIRDDEFMNMKIYLKNIINNLMLLKQFKKLLLLFQTLEFNMLVLTKEILIA